MGRSWQVGSARHLWCFNGFIEDIDVAHTLEFAHKGVAQIGVHICPFRITPWHPLHRVFYLHNGNIDVGRIPGDVKHEPTTATRLVQLLYFMYSHPRFVHKLQKVVSWYKYTAIGYGEESSAQARNMTRPHAIELF
jgi:hypothetical protein